MRSSERFPSVVYAGSTDTEAVYLPLVALAYEGCGSVWSVDAVRVPGHGTEGDGRGVPVYLRVRTAGELYALEGIEGLLEGRLGWPRTRSVVSGQELRRSFVFPVGGRL